MTQLHGYNGDTGAVIYAGTDVMTGTRKWNSGIAARGSIYVANDNKVYAFRIPTGGTPTPTRLLQPLLRPLLLHCHSNGYCNCYTMVLLHHCDSHGNFDSHANCDSDANCHSLRFRQSDSDTQTNPHSETPYDTEAAPESAAKTGRSEPMIR